MPFSKELENFLRKGLNPFLVDPIPFKLRQAENEIAPMSAEKILSTLMTTTRLCASSHVAYHLSRSMHAKQAENRFMLNLVQ